MENVQELAVDWVELCVENLQLVHVMVPCAGKLVLVCETGLGACTLVLADKMLPLVYKLVLVDVRALCACRPELVAVSVEVDRWVLNTDGLTVLLDGLLGDAEVDEYSCVAHFQEDGILVYSRRANDWTGMARRGSPAAKTHTVP